MISARWAVRLLAAAAVAGLVGACAAEMPRKADLAQAADPASETLDDGTVAVIERGWHTDIALPAAALTGPVASLRRDFAGASFMVFGFGDRAYLMSHKTGLGEMLAALFPGPGVMLVTGLKTAPQRAFDPDSVVTLRLTCARRGAVIGAIAQAFEVRGDGSLQRLGDGPYAGSAFYATGKVYDLFHNCNRWTADALARAGLPVATEGVVTANQVMGPVRRFAAARRPGERVASDGAAQPCPS